MMVKMQNHNHLVDIPYGQSSNKDPVEIVSHPRQLHVFHVTEDELNSVQEVGQATSLDIALACLCIGILVTLIVTISTVEIDGPKMYAAYISSLLLMLVLSLFFGVRTFLGIKRAKTKLKELKNGKS